MTSSHPLAVPCQWFSQLASALDRRSAAKLAFLFLNSLARSWDAPTHEGLTTAQMRTSGVARCWAEILVA
jgi:hypothetical protein